MATRNVVIKGDEILGKKCREIKDITPRIRETMQDMLETMRKEMGVGIAAPQVGVMRRMFVAEPDPMAEEERVYFMINPDIYEREGEVEGMEGCLSVPGKVGTVVRPQRIKMRAQDLEGEWHEYEFEDFDARVMCHEYDHLEGILYTDIATEVHDAMDDYEEEEEA